MDIYSRVYCKTRHADRMWNFNPFLESHLHIFRKPDVIFVIPAAVTIFLDFWSFSDRNSTLC